MEAGGHAISSPLGRITISSDVITRIVGKTAAECYGVVGMSARGRVGRLLVRGRERQGIEIGGDATASRSTCTSSSSMASSSREVAATVRSRVAYELERQTGLHVAAIEVHIQDVRRSA